MEPPNEGRPPPGAIGRGLRKNVCLGSSDENKSNPPSYPAQPRSRSSVLGDQFPLYIPGIRLPTQPGVLIHGGRHG